MSGNVWEWCWDIYAEDYYRKNKHTIGTVCNPRGPRSGKDRVIRGSSWSPNDDNCRVTNRNGCKLGNSGSNCGFRIARSVE